MKNFHKNSWIDDKDLSGDISFIESSSNELQPIAVESILEDESAGLIESNRRDFLKILGFGVGAATLASCEIPIKKAIPYTIRPDDIVPGVANYYASTFVDGGDVCSVLVKTREGRPIKIEGNSLSPIFKAGTSARAQASVLSLYDYNRIRKPAIMDGQSLMEKSWEEIDSLLKKEFSGGGQIRILSRTMMSPSLKNAISEFSAKYNGTKHVMYDPISSAAMLDANLKNFNQRAIPEYRFDLADVIVSFNADFLGTWISPVEYAAQYAKRRKIDAKNASMSKHIQVESGMSLTGSNADNRILVKPSEQGAAIAFLYNAIASQTGGATITSPALNDKAKAALTKVATSLTAAKGKSLVVSSSNNLGEQILINSINQALQNVGQTLSFSRASMQRQGNDQDMAQLVKDMQAGSISSLIIIGANPCYDHPMGATFAEALAKVKNSVCTNSILDETASMCKVLVPDNHYLESWGDVEIQRGRFSLIQPTINPLFNTRQIGVSLLTWTESANFNAKADQAYYEYLKNYWSQNILSKAKNSSWDQALHDGVIELSVPELASSFSSNVTEAASLITKPSGAETEISFYEAVNMGVGQYANNPWLMEMPDPVMRTVWGNYLAIPIRFDGDRRFISAYNVKENGELVDLSLGSNTYQVGTFKQFGQMEGTVSIALGYGRSKAGVCGTGIGTDFYNQLPVKDGYTQYFLTDIKVGNSSGVIEKNFACVQHHHTLGVTAIETSTGNKINADEAALVDDAFKPLTKGYQGSLTKRTVLRHANLKELPEAIKHLEEERAEAQKLNSHTLYPGHSYLYNSGHHWGMHIDLNACTGCAACTVACMAENNVPVVGKREVSRHHEMTWLRIDRYFYGDVESPNVVYQPMMCQHCNNAPCENVCPVNATNHSSEGLNQMAYNRCVGTRYCANNCPYKVRRFNWYDFMAADLFPVNQHNINKETDKPFYAENLVRMVLNPDVTVRSRGVIEKCSFCVQRIQEGKLNAKKDERSLTDSDVKTACQTACPTGAITFGDMNNESGVLTGKLKNPLNYIVLEEVNVQSVVNYTMKVINRDESLDA
ncbi:MAG: 4Fe-4S dicluster domain-containing protein [Saprospiraceae bacterium]|nr:4Fe-4S dicluster domain-containing protein [Saprospiraceae bacterium]